MLTKNSVLHLLSRGRYRRGIRYHQRGYRANCESESEEAAAYSVQTMAWHPITGKTGIADFAMTQENLYGSAV
jgi:hypothetical protein